MDISEIAIGESPRDEDRSGEGDLGASAEGGVPLATLTTADEKESGKAVEGSEKDSLSNQKDDKASKSKDGGEGSPGGKNTCTKCRQRRARARVTKAGAADSQLVCKRCAIAMQEEEKEALLLATKGGAKEPPPPKVSFSRLYRFADCCDVMLIIVGVLAGIVRGLALPAFSILFGDMIDGVGSGTLAVCDGSFDPSSFGGSGNFSALASVNGTGAGLPGLPPGFDPADMLAGMTDNIVDLGIIFVYVGIGQLVAAFVQRAALVYAAERQIERIRVSYLESIFRQEIGWFDVEGANTLYSRISADTIVLHGALGLKLGELFQFLFQFVGGFGVGFFYSWKMTLVLLAVTPLLAGAGAFMMVMISQLTEGGQKDYAQAGAVAFEMLSGLRTVATLKAEREACASYDHQLASAMRTGKRKGLINGFGFGLLMGLFYGTYALGLWFAGLQIAAGEMTGGDAMIVFFAVIMGGFSIGQMGPSFTAIGNGQAVAHKIYGTIDRKSKIDALDRTTGQHIQRDDVKGHIELKNVHFRYPSRPDVPVLKGINIEAKPGQTIAFVGPSGSGKSSTIQLVLRFYDPDSGSVSLDGVDISTLNVRSLRSVMGFVQQQPILFSGSIAENIAYGLGGTEMGDATKVSQEQIERAARAANAHDFIIGFPDGYNTPCGAKGRELSGGQKQRIAIARALIRDPKILLLDEATSALDTESESIVQAALDSATEGRTVLVIAHRLSTIKNADLIYVIENGLVVQQGTYMELSRDRDGMFRNMVKAQGMATATMRGKVDKLAAEEAMMDAVLAQTVSVTPATSSDLVVRAKAVKDGMSTEDGGAGAGGESDADQDGDDNNDNDDDDVGAEDPEVVQEAVKGAFGKVAAMNATEWPYYVIGILMALANGAHQPFFAIVLVQVLDVFFKCADEVEAASTVWIYVMLYFAVGILAISLIQLYAFGAAGQELIRRVRSRLFRHMLRQESGWHDDKRHTAVRLNNRLASDAELLDGIFGAQLGVMVQTLGTLGAGLGIGFYYSWEMSLVVLATVPFIAGANGAEMAAFQGQEKKMQLALEDANAVATESISNVRTVVAFGTEHAIMDHYKHELAGPRRANLKGALIGGFLMGLGQLLLYSSNFLHFWFGSTLIGVGPDDYKFNDIMVSLMAMFFMAMGLGQSMSMGPDLNKARAAAGRVFAVLDRESQVDPFDGKVDRDGKQIAPVDQPSPISGSIELKDVHFVYPSRPDAPVLRGVSLSIEAGKLLALVGPSGSGKSSIVLLLERLYQYQKGQILIDGKLLEDYPVEFLRSQIAIVGQECTLFTGTVADNIAFGMDPKPSLADIEDAARMANAFDFIDAMPQKFNTFIGEDGAQLSGGQRQRVGIARAIVRKPKILLLDEATSALDTRSEQVVQAAIDNVLKEGKMTAVAIAHRLSTIKNADKICVISAGKKIEEGTHDELMQIEKGTYRSLVLKQT